MSRLRKMGLRTPVVYFVDQAACTIYMEYINGSTVKDLLQKCSLTAENISELMVSIGTSLAIMHDGGLAHGDLTTSNLMVDRKSGELVCVAYFLAISASSNVPSFQNCVYNLQVMIDFGLSANTVIPEDKAVDLYVLERAFTSAHPEQTELVSFVFCSAY